MISRASLVSVFVALLLATAGPTAAQEGGFTIEAVDTSSHPEVAVTVTVENQLVGDVAPRFKIIEDGRSRPVTVESTASSDLKVVLLLDVSGSMQGAPLEAAKAAAARFVTEMPAGVQIGIISFGNTPALASGFTDDRQTLLTAIELLNARGETALYDGLAAAAALFSNESSEGRTVVLLSDGGDTVSSNSLDDAVVTVEELDATLFAVELESPENDSDALFALATAAGGTVTSADDPAALGILFSEIASELLSSYRLVFTSEAFDLASLRIDVVAGGSVVAGANRWIELPADTSLVDSEPEPGSGVEPAPVAIPPLRKGSTIELSWLETGTASWLGAGAIFLAFAIVFTTISLRPRTPLVARGRSTLTASPSQLRTRDKKTALSVIADSATALAEQTLNRGDRFKTLNAALERAGVALRPGEFLVLAGSGALAAAAIGFLLINEAVGLLFAGIVIGVAPLWLSSKTDKRSALFGEQLGDTLQLMSSSMRAGYGLLQAIDAVAEEALSPTAEEFQRIKIETHLGRDLDESLKAAAGRVDSEDFRWVAEAIEIHRQIGGDLAEILDAVNETIRDRNKIRRRIKSLSAEGRISGVILSLIPIVLVFVILIINPGYIGELTSNGLGQGLIVGGIVAWLIAVAWMRKIIRLQF